MKIFQNDPINKIEETVPVDVARGDRATAVMVAGESETIPAVEPLQFPVRCVPAVEPVPPTVDQIGTSLCEPSPRGVHGAEQQIVATITIDISRPGDRGVIDVSGGFKSEGHVGLGRTGIIESRGEVDVGLETGQQQDVFETITIDITRT